MNFKDKDVLSFGLGKSDVVKLNEEESFLLSEIFYGKKLGKEEFSKRAAEQFDIACVIITLGEKGCYAFCNGKEYTVEPLPVFAADTIGAGDAFSSAFLYSYLSGFDLEGCLKNGNLLGAFVASKTGALPELDENIINKIKR